MSVVVTAGHVDHGKSTLVAMLTGTDPDRLPQEKARGLTLDLGFASMRLPSGRLASFVDVPGHERLVGTMVAGAGAAAGCLFAVDGREGWRAQSEEHLRILELLGVTRAVVAVTRSPDGVVPQGVRERLGRSDLAAAPVLAVDLPAGVGEGLLVAALDELVDVPFPADEGRPRLWIDRAFSIRGAGTVVTGTLTGGKVAVGDALVGLPAGVRGRVRGIEEHGAPVDVVGPGRRAALNLAGVAAGDLGRGDVLVAPDAWDVADHVLADVAVVPGAEVGGRGAHVLHVGTRAMSVRLGVAGGGRVTDTGTVRLRLPVPLPLTAGDRFVLRDAGRWTTVGGGHLRGPVPHREALPAEQPVPDDAYLALLRAHPFDPPAPDDIEPSALGALRASGAAVSAQGVWFAAEAVDLAAARLAPHLEGGLTVAEARDLLGSTRRPVLALLDLLDARGVTVRRGERRWPGVRSGAGGLAGGEVDGLGRGPLAGG